VAKQSILWAAVWLKCVLHTVQDSYLYLANKWKVMNFLFAVIHLILTPERMKLELNFSKIQTCCLS